MNQKYFQKIRLVVTMYVSILVGVGVSIENAWLAIGGVVTGMMLMWMAKKKIAVKTSDERTQHIAGKAATYTYSIMSSSLALLSLILILGFKNQTYLQSIGIILSYVALTMIGIFALLYRYFLNQES